MKNCFNVKFSMLYDRAAGASFMNEWAIQGLKLIDYLKRQQQCNHSNPVFFAATAISGRAGFRMYLTINFHYIGTNANASNIYQQFQECLNVISTQQDSVISFMSGFVVNSVSYTPKSVAVDTNTSCCGGKVGVCCGSNQVTVLGETMAASYCCKYMKVFEKDFLIPEEPENACSLKFIYCTNQHVCIWWIENLEAEIVFSNFFIESFHLIINVTTNSFIFVDQDDKMKET